jgi:hypothetical protein
MNIDNRQNSRKLAFLWQFIDYFAETTPALFELANKLKTPEELARTPEYFYASKEILEIRKDRLQDVIETLKYID